MSHHIPTSLCAVCASAPQEGHVEMVTLKSAGHNVHVDDLPGEAE